MTSPVLRVPPSQIKTTLKEAIVDALLGMTHAEVSGGGRYGKYLFGARPRTLLSSGFLLPQLTAEGDDEVTSPIWISSHGLQLQVALGLAGLVMVQPHASVYVRILPTEMDLERPDCKAVFRLNRDVAKALRTVIRERLDEAWEKVKGTHSSKAKHPDWKRIKDEISEKAYAERGIPRTLIGLEAPATEDSLVGADDLPPEEGVIAPAGGGDISFSDDNFDPLTPPHKWLRIDLALPCFSFDPSESLATLQNKAVEHATAMNAVLQARLKSWAEDIDPETGGKLWGFRSGQVVKASQYKKWSEFLDVVRKSSAAIALPAIVLKWHIEKAADGLNPSCQNLLIALENVSRDPRQHSDETDPAVFLVHLDTLIPTALHRNLQLERVKPSYRYNRYLRYPAMGHNSGVELVSKDGEMVRLRTTWAPRYVQPRIVPTGDSGIQRRIRALSSPSALEDVMPILPAMQAWLDSLPGKIDPSAGLDPTDIEAINAEIHEFAGDLQKWSAEKAAIEAGLTILAESREAWGMRGPQSNPKASVFEAWLAMNEAMANFMRIRFGNDDGQWHLFQLAFILASIPALASRMPEFKHHYVPQRDDTVTLLYFATGGGKSEAFFGLLVFNLMLDRLRGKHTGVTAMIRYPLRLLTIQQAQRCSKVLAQAELVRRDQQYGGDSFSIGFWVGSGGSPNRHNTPGVSAIPDIDTTAPDVSTEETLRENDSKYSVAWRAWNKIPTCPFCGGATALRRFVSDGDTLAHVCSSTACAANQGGWRPLPFYICDEDIYDLAPSVLLGTVDKLALIGHSSGTIRRIYGMLGAAPWRKLSNKRLRIPTNQELREGPAAAGCEPLFPAYAEGLRLFHDPFPSLLIQDEAHLLDESLGTFAGLFESTLDAIFVHLSRALWDIVAKTPGGQRRRAKVIAASATVSDPERQLEHLYQREVPAVQFPHPGPSLYESFYAGPREPDASEAERLLLEDTEQRACQARVYCAFMTNGKAHTTTSVAVLSSFHLCISRLFDGLVAGDEASRQLVREYLIESVRSGQLQSLHQDSVRAATAGELLTVIDLHRIALTYVTNKKGGDQIMAAELEETRKRHVNANVPLDGLDTRLITGSVEQGEIQAVVQQAQTRDKPGEPFTPLGQVLRSVIATSAISHGVDVEEFNSMFFAGMPSDIAEYIQASSRVGRTHIGFVVLIPTPQRRRDRYIVEVFDIFHRFLERMVQPAAIDRWAEKAVERVLPSLLQAYLVGVLPSRELIKLAEADKAKVKDFTYIPNITREYTERRDAFIKDINTFIELAIGLRDGYAPEGAEHYRALINDKTGMIIKQWTSSAMYGGGPLKSYFDDQTDTMKKPMTSLRDVDQGGVIRMSYRDANGKKQRPEDVLKAMALIRHGVAETDDEVL